jgi:hypothetical protein
MCAFKTLYESHFEIQKCAIIDFDAVGRKDVLVVTPSLSGSF